MLNFPSSLDTVPMVVYCIDTWANGSPIPVAVSHIIPETFLKSCEIAKY